MGNLLIHTVSETNKSAFDKAVNEFTQDKTIFVKATQTHYSHSDGWVNYVAVIFYEMKI